MNTDNSKKIYKKAKESIPGGVNSPVRAFQSVDKEYPIFIKSGNGSKLYDEDGNEYVDMIGSWGPMILGHNYPQVLEVVKRELENGTSFGLPTKKEVELAELVKSCFPSIEKLRLTTSGTEAAMASVRLARAFTGKNKIIKFEGCYHGHSDSLLVKAGSGLLTFEHQDSNGITEGVVKDTITLPFGDFEKLKETLENNKDIACVIIEPIPANMGIIETEKEYLEKVREITQKENIVLIFDEVISGFRVSLGGAQKIFGITPDLTILGKIIGGGYPVGGFGGKREIMDLISPVGNVYHAGTLSGNPISVAAGIETISILKEKPAGRKPVKTEIISPASRAPMNSKIKTEISNGRQVFIIVPAIQEGKNEEIKNVETEFKRLKRDFKGLRILQLHGKMKSEEKEQVMTDFLAKKADILLSTTVIEVGVDIPNASVIVIENADRFGLAQLHQLRGRVGRGGGDAFCYLVMSSNAKPPQRLQEISKIDDGFILAEKDLELRGAGEIYGKAQSGEINLEFANIGV